MTLTTAGLTGGGQTAHYRFQYDDSLALSVANPAGPEPARTNAVIAACEGDFAQMASWFGGAVAVSGINVHVTSDSGGASWSGSSSSSTVLIKAQGRSYSGSPDIIRYLLVAEVTEIMMMTQGSGWFQGHDEGSKGEALSRFLGAQFLDANGLTDASIRSDFAVADGWLNSPRLDFVNNAPDDNAPDAVNGCTTLFVYFLFSQLGYGIQQIVGSGAATLAGVYRNLSGDTTDPFPFFKRLLDEAYPGTATATITGPNPDDPFPLGRLSWAGDFTKSSKTEILFNYVHDGNWRLGTFTGDQIGFTLAGNTVGFGNLADGAHPSWVGDFTGSGKTEVLFNYVGDGNWWLGSFTGNQIGFTLAGNTVGFGNLADGAHPSWVGDFTGSGKTEVVFNYVGDGNWWLGTFTGNQIGFTLAGNTAGFGNLADGAHPSWVGDFTGSGKTEVLFNYVGDGNWWLGTFTGDQIGFTLAGNTVGFGNLADGAHPSWVGDFTGSGKTEVLFNYVGDGNWWLGAFTGNQIGFTLAGNTVGFGNLADGAHPSWVGDLTGSGKTEVLFNYVGDGNWWLGTFTGDQIGFTLAGNTVGFGNLADGAHPSWVGDFTGSGKTEVLFNYVGDGNWWLGAFTGNQISFTLAGDVSSGAIDA